MPQQLEWSDIAVRLAVAAAASALIGFNREGRGQSVGLRTTMLVCLAAAISMIQVNLLLSLHGKAADSYVVMDLMRLPLGILSGMGFIGAGAIVRRGDLVKGVTTAATMWYVTVMGLCFGGGQLALGVAALALGVLVLWCLKRAEIYFGIERRATLTIAFAAANSVEPDVSAALVAAGLSVAGKSIAFAERGEHCRIRYDVSWHETGRSSSVPDFTSQLARHRGVVALEWQPIDGG